MVTKLRERSPIKSDVVRNALLWFNLVMKIRLGIPNYLLKQLKVHKLKSLGSDVDRVPCQRLILKIFLKFDREKERLHDFLQKLKINEKYEELTDVLILTLIVRTGQAFVKGGFTTNNPALKVDLK